MKGTSRAMKSVIIILFMVAPSTTGNHEVNSTTSTLNTTTAPNKALMILEIRLNLTISMTFRMELQNSSSEDYLHLAGETEGTLNNVFNGLNGLLSVVINSFRAGSVIVDYDLQFDGETNLMMLLDYFALRLERLEQATIDGSNVTFDAITINDQFKRAATLQETGNICDIAKCNNGYVCRNEFSSCIHICTFFDNICRDKGGCVYDPVRDEALCRCTDDAVFLENACQYQQSGQSSQNLAEILPGTIVGVVVLIVGGLLIYCFRSELEKCCRDECPKCDIKGNCSKIFCCIGTIHESQINDKEVIQQKSSKSAAENSTQTRPERNAESNGKNNKTEEQNCKTDDGLGSGSTRPPPPPYSKNDPQIWRRRRDSNQFQ